MEENFDQNQDPQPKCPIENKNNKNECGGSGCWVKYLVITLAAFFGAFLAVYFVADTELHKYCMQAVTPPAIKVDDLDDILKEQDRMMQDLTKYKPAVNPFFINPVKLQTFQENNDYKIILDLKPFGGTDKNIKVDVKPTSVKISGNSDKNDKNIENRISFSQSFSLPQKVNVKGVTKVKNGDRYVITIPIDEHEPIKR